MPDASATISPESRPSLSLDEEDREWDRLQAAVRLAPLTHRMLVEAAEGMWSADQLREGIARIIADYHQRWPAE